MTKRKQIIITASAAILAFLIQLILGWQPDGRLIGSVIIVAWMITSIKKQNN